MGTRLGAVVRTLIPARPGALTDTVPQMHGWADMARDDVGAALASCPRVAWLLRIGATLAARGLVAADAVPSFEDFNRGHDEAFDRGWVSWGDGAGFGVKRDAACVASEEFDRVALAWLQRDLAPLLAAALAPMVCGAIGADPEVLRALGELGVSAVADDDHATAWRVALSPALRNAADSYTEAAIRRLAVSLAGADLAGARRAALWITAPDEAMAAALAEGVRAGAPCLVACDLSTEAGAA